MDQYRDFYRVGIDVGGTNTDAVLVQFHTNITSGKVSETHVVAQAKAPTTGDVTSGIRDALDAVFQKVDILRSDLLSVNIGTTHFINAIIQADETKLNPVAVLRLCGPFCREVKPFWGFPERLKEAIYGYAAHLNGGLEIDGRIITEIDEDEVCKHLRAIEDAGVVSVVVNGVFTPLDTAKPSQEERVRNIILKHHPDWDVVCSRDIGGIGYLARENAAILNAAVLELGRETVYGFEEAIKQLNLHCPLYLTQNDGTVMKADVDSVMPIRTFASGATNSLVGGIFLSGVTEKNSKFDLKSHQLILVDVGGTTSDFAALSASGFPREAPAIVMIGGVRTAFRMPEVHSIGLGGGSRVQEVAGRTSVGPTSVGFKLGTESQCFGGEVMTATDIAVARGQLNSITPQWDAGPPSQDVIDKASQNIRKQLQNGVDKMKTSDLPVVLLLVGGGSVIQMDDLEGVAECIRPPFYDVANAVGAAIAKISGETDTIQIPAGRTYPQIQEALSQEAIKMAARNGAEPHSIKIVDAAFMPLQYMTNEAVRVVVKAIGDLCPTHQVHRVPNGTQLANGKLTRLKRQRKPQANGTLHTPEDEAHGDLSSYIPTVSKTTREWIVSDIDLAFIADGCGVLGTGGGGATYAAYVHSVQVRRACQEGRMRVIEPQQVDDQSPVAAVAFVGAPAVFNERMAGDEDLSHAVRGLAEWLKILAFGGVICGEIGGANGMRPFAAGAHLDLPVIDADTMGRAFPRVDLALPAVYNVAPPYPAVVADGRNNFQVIGKADSHHRLERLARTACIEYGNMASFCHTITGKVLKSHCPHNTISQAWFIGRAAYIARQKSADVVQAVMAAIPGATLLFNGKICQVTNSTRNGWSFGTTTLNLDQGDDDDELDECQSTQSQPTSQLLLEFQNEFLHAALLPGPGKKPETICSTPDMITVLERSTGTAIAANELRFGLRVSVVAFPGHELWRSPEGMKASSPAAFGFDNTYIPLGTTWERPASVIETYAR